MGKRYYTGVPGIEEQFAPIVSSTLKKGMSHTESDGTMSVAAMVSVMLVGLPILPLWSAPMLAVELLKSRKLTPGTPEHRQNQVNIQFAGICLFVGVLLYSIFSPW